MTRAACTALLRFLAECCPGIPLSLIVSSATLRKDSCQRCGDQRMPVRSNPCLSNDSCVWCRGRPLINSAHTAAEIVFDSQIAFSKPSTCQNTNSDTRHTSGHKGASSMAFQLRTFQYGLACNPRMPGVAVFACLAHRPDQVWDREAR